MLYICIQVEQVIGLFFGMGHRHRIRYHWDTDIEKVKYKKFGGKPPVPPIASHGLPLKYKCLAWPP
jgi:hypothetical protein